MRRLAAVLVVMALATIVVVQVTGALAVVLWETVVVLALASVVWKRWPGSEVKRTGLLGEGEGFGRRPPGGLTSLELEVLGATDERLGGDRRLRRRLMSLADHRAGPGVSIRSEGGRLLGEDAWVILAERSGALSPEELEMVVTRIEAM